MHVALVGAEFEENLAIRYLWGALEAAGHTVAQIVFNAPQDLERAARELAGSGAELAGFSMVFTRRAREFADLATRARELGYRGHVVAGGHFAAFHAERAPDRRARRSTRSASARARRSCASCARTSTTLAAVPGLVWRDGDARSCATRRPPSPRTSTRCRCRRASAPFDRYLGLPITNLLGSRGCLHALRVLLDRGLAQALRAARACACARPEHIADEMAGLYRQGVRIFNFHDDNFFLPRRRRHAGARRGARPRALARTRRRPHRLRGQGRPDAVDEELFA